MKGALEEQIVVVWGSTGNGKSTLANRLLGLEYDINGNSTTNDQEPFAVSADAESMTRDTITKQGYWFGDPSYGPVTIIDTPGLGDTAGPGQDSINIANMIKELKSIKPGIHLFLLVFNNNPRFDNHLQELITLFDKMFSSQIWNNVALCFTNYAQDEIARRKRAASHKAPDGTPEEKERWVQGKVGGQFVGHIQKLLGMEEFPKLPCFFVDSVPDIADNEHIKFTMAEYLRLIMRFSTTRTAFSCAEMVLVKRKTDELEGKLKESQQAYKELYERLLLEAKDKVENAEKIVKATEDKISLLNEIEKTRKEKDVLAAALQKELDEKAAIELKGKIAENERIIKEKVDQLKNVTEEKTQAEENAKKSEEKIKELEDSMKKLRDELAVKLETEAKGSGTISSTHVFFKSNIYGRMWKDQTNFSRLEVCTSLAVEDFFYRVVHISDLHAPILFEFPEDASSDGVFKGYAHYFAEQKFRVAKLPPFSKVQFSDSLWFVPHSKGFGNLYHYVSVKIKGKHRSTIKNWAVKLDQVHSYTTITLSIMPELIMMHTVFGNFVQHLKLM